MRRLFQIGCCVVLLLFTCTIAGCSKKYDANKGIPMPKSAKHTSSNTVEITFPPYAYNLSGGVERWIIERVDSPDNLVFSVIYQDKSVVRFPLGNVGPGIYKINGDIKIDGVVYRGVSVTLNKNIDTGSIKLEKSDA